MRSGVESGDKVELTYPEGLLCSGTATVDYVVPEYGYVICNLDRSRGRRKSVCLHDDQYGYYWRRVMPAYKPRGWKL